MGSTPESKTARKQYTLSNNAVVGPEGAAVAAFVLELGQRVGLEADARRRAMQEAHKRCEANQAEAVRIEEFRDAQTRKHEAENKKRAREEAMKADGMRRVPIPAGPPWTPDWIKREFRERVPDFSTKFLGPNVGIGALMHAAEYWERLKSRGKQVQNVSSLICNEAQAVMAGKRQMWIHKAKSQDN